VIVMLTSACVEAHGAFVIVQRSTTGPAPVRCVKVDEGLLTALSVPVPPLTTLQVPVPGLAALPPKLVVVPDAQMFCVPPTVAAGASGCATTDPVFAAAVHPFPAVTVRLNVRVLGTAAPVGLCMLEVYPEGAETHA